MPLSLIRHVRGRLLALLALIIIPLALVSIIIATTTYRSVTQSIELAQVQTASNYSVRARIWFRGILRTAFSTGATVASLRLDQTACNDLVEDLVHRLDGFGAMQITLDGGMVCSYSRIAGVVDKDLADLAERQLRRPVTTLIAGQHFADARYDIAPLVTSAGQKTDVFVVAHASAKGDATHPPFQVMLLVDPKLLDQTFSIGAFSVGSAVALVKEGGQVLVARGVDEHDRSWLPNDLMLQAIPTRWEDNEAGQTRRAYASEKVFEPDLYILARFEDTARSAAALQFWILCLIPLAMLLILGIAYSRSIQSDIVNWMGEIEAAAQANIRTPDTLTLARLGAGMPLDIRRVAESYNSMASSAHRREQDLRRALDANFELMRELHHRVKNSLQVIQSYLALSRRLTTGDRALHIAETGVKVQVLSAAYRLSLTDQGLRPAPIEPFVQEIIGNLTSSSRKSGQWIETRVESDAELIVDRMIPLGLAIVEAVLAGLRAPEAQSVTVRLANADNHSIALTISSDGTLTGKDVSPRVLSGLATQLGATVRPSAPGEIINWTFET